MGDEGARLLALYYSTPSTDKGIAALIQAARLGCEAAYFNVASLTRGGAPVTVRFPFLVKVFQSGTRRYSCSWLAVDAEEILFHHPLEPVAYHFGHLVLKYIASYWSREYPRLGTLETYYTRARRAAHAAVAEWVLIARKRLGPRSGCYAMSRDMTREVGLLIWAGRARDYAHLLE